MNYNSEQSFITEQVAHLTRELADTTGLTPEQVQQICVTALATSVRHSYEKLDTVQDDPYDLLDKRGITNHNFPDIYTTLDIDTKCLGCVMVELDGLNVVTKVPGGADDLYYSKDERFTYAQGAVGEKDPHVTLLYGLMESGTVYQSAIEHALIGWQAEDIVIEGIDFFDSPVETEEFYCIVAKVKPTLNLLEGNARLRLLPHISTFPTYKPHVTLAYIKKDPDIRDKWIKYLSGSYTGRILAVKNTLKLK
jgi:2'-5' RNA ligase